MGGFGVWHFVSKYPKLFIARIPIASPMKGMESIKKVPFYVIHAENDEYASASILKKNIDLMKENGANIAYEILEGARYDDAKLYENPIKNSAKWLKKILDIPSGVVLLF